MARGVAFIGLCCCDGSGCLHRAFEGDLEGVPIALLLGLVTASGFFSTFLHGLLLLLLRMACAEGVADGPFYRLAVLTAAGAVGVRRPPDRGAIAHVAGHLDQLHARGRRLSGLLDLRGNRSGIRGIGIAARGALVRSPGDGADLLSDLADDGLADSVPGGHGDSARDHQDQNDDDQSDPGVLGERLPVLVLQRFPARAHRISLRLLSVLSAVNRAGARRRRGGRPGMRPAAPAPGSAGESGQDPLMDMESSTACMASMLR